MNKVKVVFVVVCWNNQDLLEECFESIKKQTYKNHTTILIDNGSEDNSVEVASKLMPKAKIIEANENLGFAKGNNVGIKQALKDNEVGYVALINTDARIDKHWLENIVEFAASKPRGACFQGTTLDYYDHSIIDSTHIFLSQNGQATQGGWRNEYIREDGPRKVYGVNAAACVISRNFINAQPFGDEFFDEDMFMYLEDVDVATRATIMRWDNYLVPNARAFHMGSASSGKNPGFSLYMTFRNNSGLIAKNFPFRLLVKLLMNIPKSDIDTIKHLRQQGDKRSARMVIKGRLVGFIFLPIYILKRRKLTKLIRIDSKYLWGLMKKGF